MNDDKPNEHEAGRRPGQDFHEWKIEQLERLRKPPVLTPVRQPGGGPPLKQHTHEDRMFNAALDRQIVFWQLQIEKTRSREDRSKVALNRAVRDGVQARKDEIKDQAKDDFALGKEKDRAKRGFNRSSGIQR